MTLMNRMTTDLQDLTDYCATGSEPAFRRMVERHAPMVHGAAMRMSRDASLAEEITQSVFVILARKAPSIPAAHLPGWLYNTASSVSRNAIRKESRRRALNQQYTEEMKTIPTDSESWNQITPHLDEAIGRLTREDRQIMILRYFEQQSFLEIAAAIGVREEACKKRAQRALERLGSMLRKRGIAASGPVLGTAITTFALLPPTAPAASISALALAAKGSLAGGAPPVFKLIQYMTTKQISAVAAVPAVNFLSLLPPIVALSAGAIWTVSQHREINRLEYDTARWEASALRTGQPQAAVEPGVARAVTLSPAAGRIDWRGFITGPPDFSARVAIKRRMQDMSAAELMSQLDEIDQLDLEDRGPLEEMVVAWLANRDPRGLLERFSARLGDQRLEQALTYAFGKWSGSGPKEAAGWLDRGIAAGRFEDPTLTGENWRLRRYQIMAISGLLDADPPAATARVAAMPDLERGGILRSMMNDLKPGQTAAMADLMRETLPRDQWQDTIDGIQDPVLRQALESKGPR